MDETATERLARLIRTPDITDTQLADALEDFAASIREQVMLEVLRMRYE